MLHKIKPVHNIAIISPIRDESVKKTEIVVNFEVNKDHLGELKFMPGLGKTFLASLPTEGRETHHQSSNYRLVKIFRKIDLKQLPDVGGVWL